MATIAGSQAFNPLECAVADNNQTCTGLAMADSPLWAASFSFHCLVCFQSIALLAMIHSFPAKPENNFYDEQTLMGWLLSPRGMQVIEK